MFISFPAVKCAASMGSVARLCESCQVTRVSDTRIECSACATDSATHRTQHSALCQAAVFRTVSLVESALDVFDVAGIINHINDEGKTALLSAIWPVADPNDEVPSDERTAQVQIVRLLLDHGALPDVYDPRHASPLVLAVALGLTSTVAVLLNHNASTELRAPSGFTALMLAAMAIRPRPNIARLLIEHGADGTKTHPVGDGDMVFTALDFSKDRITPAVGAAVWPAVCSEDERSLRAVYSEGCCNYCGKTTPNLRAAAAVGVFGEFHKLKHCGKCRLTRYCSTICQASDWPRHRQTHASGTVIELKFGHLPILNLRAVTF